jgi:hypothetical protein
LPGFDAVQEQLFWLNIELSHGGLLRELPRAAQLFVALPSSRDNRAQEEEWVKGYLQACCNWGADDLGERLHFFGVADPLIWTQDATAMLGTDSKGRRILALDSSSAGFYQNLVKGLAAAFPSRFTVHRLPQGISNEGGDMAVVRRPDGAVGLVIGRHRVLDWLKRSGYGSYVGRPVQADLLRKAREAYGRAYGLPVQVVPEAPLLEGWGSEDLFHLDMAAAFLAVSGRAEAVVPSLEANSRDSLTNGPFSPAQIGDWNRELDQIAKELRLAGYRVQRAPMADHPVRSPANSVRFDPGDGGPVQVLLSRYPDQSPETSPSPGNRQYHLALEQFKEAGDLWNQAPGTSALPALRQAVDRLWAGLARCRSMGNPLTDAQEQAYLALGCRVKSVSDFPWGAGGFHCQFLH